MLELSCFACLVCVLVDVTGVSCCCTPPMFHITHAAPAVHAVCGAGPRRAASSAAALEASGASCVTRSVLGVMFLRG